MPDSLHNYFVKYNRTFLFRGILGLCGITAYVGYRYFKDGSLSIPLEGLGGLYAFFAAFIGFALVYRNQEPR